MSLGFFSGLADALLAVAVFGIAWPALIGWMKERGSTGKSGEDRDVAMSDAKLFYALAAQQRPYVFIAAVAGSIMKLVVLVLMLFNS
jgi:hypothetical protein